MVIALPNPAPHSGSRQQATDLLDGLPDDLSASEVTIDCRDLAVSTSSFWDEVVKTVLVTRGARQLSLLDAPTRAGELARRSASNRGVADRLTSAARNHP
jgi:hypothetical protein